jgi:hypothetical protein
MVPVFRLTVFFALSQHIHIILDNYSTPKHPAIKRWLARHPRFELHFTPTGSSSDAIMQYLARHNLNPKRYVWRAKGEEILARRACRCERSPGASRQRTPEQMFAEIRRLQKENEYLKRQREILNKAMSILGEEPNPGMRTPENFAAFWEEEIHLF